MFVPAGEFLMGSTDADKDAVAHEKPQHTIYLEAYWIGKYEVTNALYKKCLDAGKCSGPKYWADGTIPTGKENHPVVGVSWNDAMTFAQWMGGRLPTEAEWEKAACWDEVKKAKRFFPWGDVFDVQKANTLASEIRDTTPVGKYSPQGDSPYGVSDMAGNVWEWVADWYSDTYYSTTPKNNPKGPGSGKFRVVRGGAWLIDRGLARCAFRSGYSPVGWFNGLGFRVVVSSSLDF